MLLSIFLAKAISGATFPFPFLLPHLSKTRPRVVVRASGAMTKQGSKYQHIFIGECARCKAHVSTRATLSEMSPPNLRTPHRTTRYARLHRPSKSAHHSMSSSSSPSSSISSRSSRISASTCISVSSCPSFRSTSSSSSASSTSTSASGSV